MSINLRDLSPSLSLGQISFRGLFFFFFFFFLFLFIYFRMSARYTNRKDANITKFAAVGSALLSRLVLIYSDSADLPLLKNDKRYTFYAGTLCTFTLKNVHLSSSPLLTVLRHCLGSVFKSIMLHDNPQSVYQRAKRELLKMVPFAQVARKETSVLLAKFQHVIHDRGDSLCMRCPI